MTVSEQIVDEILNLFRRRHMFNEWWESIDPSTQKDILGKMLDIVKVQRGVDR